MTILREIRLARAIQMDLSELFPRCTSIRVSPVARGIHSHGFKASCDTLDGNLICFVKVPKAATMKEALEVTRASATTATRLSGIPPLSSGVGFPRYLGYLPEIPALVMEYISGVRLDRRLERCGPFMRATFWKETLTSLGSWLSRFHMVEPPTAKGGERIFPYWIRGYQSPDRPPVSLESFLNRIRVPRSAIHNLVERIGKSDSFDEDRLPSLAWNYGDFRLWNIMKSREHLFITDTPVALLVDSPWRDVCAFLTSIDIVLNRLTPRVHGHTESARALSRIFLEAYCGHDVLDPAMIEGLKVASLASSLQDLASGRGARNRATQRFVTRRIRDALQGRPMRSV